MEETMSIGIDNISSYPGTTVANAKVANGSAVQNSLGGISSESSEEELKQVCNDFASYFVEEILKEMKENMLPKDEEEEDSSLSTLTDFHMDSTIEVFADQMVDEVGGSFTQQLFEQMKRNYNID